MLECKREKEVDWSDRSERSKEREQSEVVREVESSLWFLHP